MDQYRHIKVSLVVGGNSEGGVSAGGHRLAVQRDLLLIGGGIHDAQLVQAGQLGRHVRAGGHELHKLPPVKRKEIVLAL